MTLSQEDVFPTPVGVFLLSLSNPNQSLSLPHTRGGVSNQQQIDIGLNWSSPHPWGCFQEKGKRKDEKRVFPTPVGVFLFFRLALRQAHRLPHTRGGVSAACRMLAITDTSSPHPWGCFYSLRASLGRTRVFPTPVGVFLRHRRGSRGVWRLPHTRGGVSIKNSRSFTSSRSSPHPWGCFYLTLFTLCWWTVFPTPVGVFPTGPSIGPMTRSLPHTRGGVSKAVKNIGIIARSSPHPWGCFFQSTKKACNY